MRNYFVYPFFKADERITLDREPGSLSFRPKEFTTKELSTKTWPDFEKLFSKQGVVGDGWWCWCTFHHTSSFSLLQNQQPPTRAERAVKNRRKKAELVDKGCAHGILVYSDKDPVGWCQFGRREELPRIDHSRNYHGTTETTEGDPLWRITCFVVDKNYRKRGVATMALSAALNSIEERGGGIVEGYPVEETNQGPNYMYCGTVSMFKRAGFKTIGPFGKGRTRTVVMRRSI